MQYIKKGNFASFTFDMSNCDATPMDLSMSTVRFIVKRNKSDSDDDNVLFYEYVNPETNILSFQFDALQTDALLEGDYVAALKIFTSNNMNEEVWSDDVQVIRGVFNG